MGRPRTIGDVQPFALLSEGARTRVYKGYQPTLDRFVLLKVLANAGHDEALAQRFEEKARLVARVEHPNVVAVHACGRDDGWLYLIAEFVEGRDLRDVLKERSLPADLAAFIVLQAARGLAAAHDRDVLHRDLKPANLLLSTDGQVKVTDFGMASLHGAASEGAASEGAAEVRGTPAYLAPEQVLGEPPVPAADLFALGATLYEMLAGRPAFTGATTDAVLDAVLHHDPMAVLDLHADVPVPLRRICKKLLEKDPAGRYTDAGAVIDDLEHARRALGFTAAGQAELAAYLEAPTSYRPPADEAAAAENPPRTTAPGAVTPEAITPEATAPKAEKPAHRRVAVLVVGLLLLVGLSYAGIVQWSTPENDTPPTAVSNAPEERVDPAGKAMDEPEATSDTERQPAKKHSPVKGSQGEADGGTHTTDISRNPPDKTMEPADQPASRPDSVAPHGRVAPSRSDVREPISSGTEAPATGRMRVTSVPWAVVYVDGDSVGVTPMTTPLTLSAGTHRLVLEHPHLPAYEDTVRIAAGQLAERSVTLWEQVARLTVEVTPWAEVVINGAVRDTTPLARPLVLAPGTYTLALRHPAFGTWRRRLHLRAGQERAVSVNLLKR